MNISNEITLKELSNMVLHDSTLESFDFSIIDKEIRIKIGIYDNITNSDQFFYLLFIGVNKANPTAFIINHSLEIYSIEVFAKSAIKLVCLTGHSLPSMTLTFDFDRCYKYIE
jgi:hypothetical protein